EPSSRASSTPRPSHCATSCSDRHNRMPSDRDAEMDRGNAAQPPHGADTAPAKDGKPDLRLHHSSWIFGTFNYLKSFLLPLIAATIIGSNRDFALWAPAFMLVPLIG